MTKYLLFIIITLAIIVSQHSCTHDSFIIDSGPIPDETLDSLPQDTMQIDTTNIDTILNSFCDPDTVYFSRDVMPIIQGNCATSGCHDAATASDGVVLNNYENIIKTGKIVPFDLEKSDLYEKITEDNSSKIMPPTGAMKPELINVIKKWILQGAQDLTCNETEDSCNTIQVSYRDFIVPLFDVHCNGCHGTGIASGEIVLDTYTDVLKIVNAKRLYGSVARLSGYASMPRDASKLSDCQIDKIKSWIDDGAKNN